MATAIPMVSEATFEREVLKSELPVLIDLYADWCAPCKVLEPRLVEVAKELEGRLRVVRINVDQSPRLAQAFRAQSIPMLVLIVEGRPVTQLQGAVPKKDILDMVAPYLPGAEDEVAPAELAKLVKERRVLVVDVRDAGPFGRAHIPDAVNIPLADLEKRASELAKQRRPVILYDRSGGDDAKNAMKSLQGQGLPAALLKGGFLGWEADGFEVAKAS